MQFNSDVVAREISLKARNVPHLPLGLSFDVARMREEYENLMPGIIREYHSKSRSDVVRDLLRKHWHGVVLHGPNGSTSEGLTELTYDRLPGSMAPSMAADLCPYITSVTKELGCQYMLNRLMVVKPGGTLSWHSHKYDFGATDDSLTWHVPIIVPPNFHYVVCDYYHFRFGDHLAKPTEYFTQEYAPGEAMQFNSYHMHNVFNRSSEDRVSLMLYLTTREKRVGDIVMAALEKYDGPRIKPEVEL